jgi:tetratricopeptide (TPR) repeat protein
LESLVDTIVYGDLRIGLSPHHGGQIQHRKLQVTPTIRARPRQSVPAEPATLLGRDAEVAIAEAVIAGQPVEFHAVCGFGKSTLLRYLAGKLAAHTTVPVVYLRVASDQADDLRQRLVEALYTTDTPFKATPEQRTQLLTQARAVILLDDLSVRPSTVKEILDDLPHCRVIIGGVLPVLGRRGRSVPLTGLPTTAAIDLLRSDLGRDLTGPEFKDAERLCEVVDGQPLHVRQAAALLREGRHTFADLAGAAAADSFALDRLSVDALDEPQRRALALLAFAAGALLPPDLVAAITDLSDTWAILSSLRSRGLAEQDEDRFGLPICHAEDYRDLLLQHLALGDAARVLADWVRQQGSGSHDVQAATDAALAIIGYAAQRAEWSVVVRLAEAIEPVLALAGRWEAWSDVLQRGLAAARLVGDIAIQARIDHQLGIHEFVVGSFDRAREYWEEALRLSEQIRDSALAAAARSNLELLSPVPAPPPLAPRPRRLPVRHLLSKRRPVWAAAAGAAALAIAAPLAHGVASNNPPRRPRLPSQAGRRPQPVKRPSQTHPAPAAGGPLQESAATPAAATRAPVAAAIVAGRGLRYRWPRRPTAEPTARTSSPSPASSVCPAAPSPSDTSGSAATVPSHPNKRSTSPAAAHSRRRSAPPGP